jgi:uncharacterized protein (TIGR03435 family)
MPRVITRALTPSLVLLCGCSALHAQPAARLEFEVASIKPASPDPRGYTLVWRGGPGTNDPGLFMGENNSLADLVRAAYSANYYHFSAPDWMASTRFNFTARVPEGATKEQFRIMLQNLLSDRFHLVAHHESREASIYDLMVGKSGPKFKQAVEPPVAKDDKTGPAPPPSRPAFDKEGYPNLGPGRPGMAFGAKGGRMYWPEATMEFLAEQISLQVGRQVVDATGLKGKYEIALYWAPDNMRATAPSAPGGGPPPSESDLGPSMMQALQDQLGLRLEGKKAPADFLVVDHADRVPAEN